MKILQRLLPLCAMLWAASLGAATSTVPTVAIATTPLYGKSQNVHPNLLLALSVEFPTTGVAYRAGYDSGTDYVGYFNNTKCYTYDATNGYFTIAGNANAAHQCSGQFSGNFMNWAASSAIDMLRLAMTGGDRVIDTRTQTVLQRAVLQSDFFKSGSYFPVRSIASGVNTVTPFTFKTLYVASCGNHIFFADSNASGSCGSPGSWGDVTDRNGNVTQRRSYRAQVQVCDASEATSRTDLCYSYDGTNYKPVGEMQRNADRIRFGAFGYLNDGTNDTGRTQNERYGGVLRAPMKYVGDTAVNTELKSITNTTKEWDQYGVLVQNPLSLSTYSNSGVINYLNKFGRTTIASMGAPTNNPTTTYKTYDPLGELYYEAIRYLQFHPDGPTPEAVNNLTTTYTDNFAVYSKWDTDPMLNSCQRNYVLTIGDVNTHQDHYVPGNTVTGQGDPKRAKDTWSGFDVVDWTNKVGAMESNSPDVGNTNPRTDMGSLGTKNHFSSTWSTYYMAGTALWAHTSSFRPTMPGARVTTYAIDVNENGNGTVGNDQRRSQMFLAAKYGGFAQDTDGGNNDNNPFRTVVDGKTVTSNAEWEASPAGSNVPKNWFLASQPAEMIKAIKNIFAAVGSGAGTLSGIALSSNQVFQDQTVYTPGYDTSWTGSLTAYPLERSSDGDITISSIKKWEAGERLANRTPASRGIYTLNAATKAGVPFLWDSIDKTQQTLLNFNPDTNGPDSLGAKRLDYLRGDRTQESGTAGTGTFRKRNGKLGDIINSGPAYVGVPAGSRPGAGYGTFYTTYAARTPMVYVGANDGMLHGFNARTGDEVFAYIPNAVFGALAQLTSLTYNHRAYVDATPTISEAQIGDRWKSVLTSGFGGGAQGVFALDVTDPTGSVSGSTFNGSNVIWEFTDQDDPDMGNVMGKPVIVKLRTGSDTSGSPTYKWFVVVGNGLNANQVDKTTGTYNEAAPAALFILSLDKAPGAAWTRNVNYWKIVTPAPSAIPPYTSANGLSTPVVVAGSSGSALQAYAGDLQGNLWKFALSGLPETWNDGDKGALPAYGGSPRKPLFVAKDANGNRQPITIQPQVVYAPGGYMVVFGTGKYYEPADTTATPTQTNSFYGIFDGGGTDYVKDRSELNKLKLTYSADGNSIKYDGTAYAPGYAENRKPGWVMDFLDGLERQVTSAVLSNGLVYFNSISTASANCDLAGTSRSYALSALTGFPINGVTGYLATDAGLLGAPVVITTTVEVGDRGSVGGVGQNTTTQVLSYGPKGALASLDEMKTTTKQRPGRLGWREIRNFKMN